MNKPVVGVAVAAAVLGAALLLRGGTDETRAAKPSAAMELKDKGKQSPETVLAISPGAATPKLSGPAAPRLSPLMQEYASKKGRKALYDRLSALSTRTAEESYVLAELMNDCREMSRIKELPKPFAEIRNEKRKQVQASLSDKDPAKEKRLAAWDVMSNGTYVCAGFGETNFTRQDVRAAMARAAEAGNPGARARLVEIDIWAPFIGPEGYSYQGNDSKLPTVSDAQLATLREALASNDPTAIMVAGRLLSGTPLPICRWVRTSAPSIHVRSTTHGPWSLVTRGATAVPSMSRFSADASRSETATRTICASTSFSTTTRRNNRNRRLSTRRRSRVPSQLAIGRTSNSIADRPRPGW